MIIVAIGVGGEGPAGGGRVWAWRRGVGRRVRLFMRQAEEDATSVNAGSVADVIGTRVRARVRQRRGCSSGFRRWLLCL